MRKKALCVILGIHVSCSPIAYAQQEQQPTTISEGTQITEHTAMGLPKNFTDFKIRCQTMLKYPKSALKMYFDAVFCYINPQTRDEAKKMLAYIMRLPEQWYEARRFYTFVTRMEDPQAAHIFRSFVAGTSPKNGYKMSPSNYMLQISGERTQSNQILLDLTSSGTDSKRTVHLEQVDGLWYIANNHATTLWVRMPIKD